MSFPLFIVNKYIRSQNFSFLLSFVSVITITGITLGVTVVIIALSILDGFDSVISEKIVNFNSHIIISGYSGKNVIDSKKTENKIQSVSPEIKSVSKYISKNTIIKSKAGTDGIVIFGIDPVNNNLDIKRIIKKGKYLSSSRNLSQILIGRKLAEKLRVKVGDKVTLFTLMNNRPPSVYNMPVISQFVIVGIYESGMPEYDDLKGYIPLSKAKIIFNMRDEISGYNIRLSNLKNINGIADKLKETLRYPYYVRTIFQKHQNIFTWIDLQKKPIPLVLGLIVVVAIFNIIGTVLMNILERKSEIGILKSLGATQKQILQIFLYQGTYLGVIGIILGALSALVLSLIQINFQIIRLPESVYFLNVAPIKINFFNYLMVMFSALLLTILSAIIPSVIASKISPIKSIKFN